MVRNKNALKGKKFKKRLKFFGGMAVLAGVIAAGSWVLKSCGNEKDDELAATFITTKDDAQSIGALDTPNRDETIKAINESDYIPDEMKDYFKFYVAGLAEIGHDIDLSVFKRNIELLEVVSLSKAEMKEKVGSEDVVISFNPYEHKLYAIEKENGKIDYEKVEKNIFNTCGDMLSTIFEKRNNSSSLRIGFTDDGHGLAFQKEINNRLTNRLEGYYEYVTSPATDAVHLLECSGIDENQLFGVYNDSNIYQLEKEIQKVAPKVDVSDFVEAVDLQYKVKTDGKPNNDYEYDAEVYQTAIDIFVANEQAGNQVNIEGVRDYLGTLNTSDAIKDNTLVYFDNFYPEDGNAKTR